MAQNTLHLYEHQLCSRLSFHLNSFQREPIRFTIVVKLMTRLITTKMLYYLKISCCPVVMDKGRVRKVVTNRCDYILDNHIDQIIFLCSEIILTPAAARNAVSCSLSGSSPRVLILKADES